MTTRWNKAVRIQADTPDRRAGRGVGAYATDDVPAGAVVLPLVGRVVRRPARHTLQIGADRHLAPLTTNPADPRAAWSLLNHSCDPTCAIDLDRMAIVARRDITAGDELTFDYCTTELEMAAPFACACGAASCYGEVRGFRHLSPAQQRRLRPRLPRHVAARIDARPTRRAHPGGRTASTREV